MRRRTSEVKTSLYDLISVLHDQPEIDNTQIPETVRYLAQTGKIRWLKKQSPDADVPPVAKKRRLECVPREGQGCR